MKALPARFILITTAISVATNATECSSSRNHRLQRGKLVDTITFDNPTFQGKLLDWCLTFHSDCGKPVADAYCHQRGYGEAIDFPKRQIYNHQQQTLTLQQRSICSPQHTPCNSFDYISCRVNQHTFEHPMEHGRRLDGCLFYDTECGVPAADAYCKDRGYGRALEYSLVQSMDAEETMTIGNHAVCDTRWHGCSAFSYIMCLV